MKYLFLLFLAGCTLSAQQQNTEQQKDAEFEKLIKKATENHSKFGEVHKKAKDKEKKLVAQAITKIVTLKSENESLKMANSLLGGEENKRDTKLKINSLIREIDYCIAQLSD